jgi:hypothetical protein
MFYWRIRYAESVGSAHESIQFTGAHRLRPRAAMHLPVISGIADMVTLKLMAPMQAITS